LALIGSGPNDDTFSWTRRAFAKLGRGGVNSLWGWALHHYAWNASGHPRAEWYKDKGDALKFDSQQYYSILRDASDMERMIRTHWDVMAESDPQHKEKLVVDEWGVWHAPGTEPFPEALLGQQSTMLDAVVAGITLDTFNRHADKVAMASVAQLVNDLQSLFFAHENRFCVTPTYHVFGLYTAHQGGREVRSVISAPDIHYTWDNQPAVMAGLSSSSSLTGNVLTVTVTNPSMDTSRVAEIVVRGGRLQTTSGVELAAPDVHAHNTFDNPRSVEPHALTVASQGSLLTHTFPPASVTKFQMTLV
jgi:alpha-N-arabinofuranosidase